MFSKCLMLILFSAFIDAQYPYSYRSQSCPYPHIDHGRVRVRQRSKLVKFTCSYRYELVGNRYATCVNGQWDVPVPVCVRPGCVELPTPANSIQNKMHHNAWVVTFCLPGYELQGSFAMYCNGYKWNTTSPTCVASAAEPSLSCDFEMPDMCGWTQDELHDFDWLRINHKTPSFYMNTGPTFDHTLGKGNSGYYMYIESTGQDENDTARLMSPVFDAQLSASGCFSFFYHMYGETAGGLRIYQKPDSLQLSEMLTLSDSVKAQYILFEQWGNLGDFWYSAAPALKDLTESFQIVIEGIRGSSVSSDIAIDDVAILQGINCTYFRIAATSPAPSYPETCADRCFASNAFTTTNVCACSINCLSEGRCCPDFLELCVFSSLNNTASTEPDDASPSDAQPQTDKLVGETSTTTIKPPTPATVPMPQTTSTTSQRTSPRITSTTRRITTTTKPTTRTPRLTTSTTVTPKTTVITTKPSTTTKPTTTRKVVTTTQKLTTEKTISTSTKATTVIINPTIKSKTTNYEEEKQKSEKEVNMQKMVGNKPIKKTSSSWKTAVITIVVLSVFAALVYLGLTARTARGRLALARLRGRISTTHDSEVRYLNSNDDDSL